MKITIDDHTIDLIPTGKSYRATIGDKTVEVKILQSMDGKLDLLIDGERVMAYISMDQSKRWVTINGQTLVLTKQSDSRKSRSGHHHSASDLTAPMPGQVRAVSVSEGEVVVKGQTLVVLEAMKMEIRIQALTDGIVKKLFVKQGQTVDREQVLIEIE
jgi:acetyl/propionyl-CoA carboxylase alpha subunit